MQRRTYTHKTDMYAHSDTADWGLGANRAGISQGAMTPMPPQFVLVPLKKNDMACRSQWPHSPALTVQADFSISAASLLPIQLSNTSVLRF